MAFLGYYPILKGKKQRILWLLVISAAIMVPLMILRANVTVADMPVWSTSLTWERDSDRQVDSSIDSVNGNASNISTLLMVSSWFDEDGSSVKTRPTQVEEDTGKPRLKLKIRDPTRAQVPFNWCVSATSDNPAPANPSSSGLNCDLLFKGDKSAISAAQSWTPPCAYTDEDMEKIVCDCDALKRRFWFESEPLSEAEYSFPLAFILVVEKNVEQIVRLLASIYQPQNIYCMTYDEHSSREFKRAIRCLSRCFDNVIMPLRHFEIYWADFSILDATMSCMRSLVDTYDDHGWRYVQILSWNDLPLKTNREMIRIFKILNGSADSELSAAQPERFRNYHAAGGFDQQRMGQSNSIPPDGLTMYKGSFAASLPRDLSRFMVHDPVAKRLFEYSRPGWAPEEQFWSTLIHNAHLNHSSSFPGTCLHFYKLENKEKTWISRFQIWQYGRCQGQMVSGSCCFGVGDLPKLVGQTGLVAHKFYSDYQPATWYCMLKWNYEKTYNMTKPRPLDKKYYHNLPAVRYQKSTNKDEFTC